MEDYKDLASKGYYGRINLPDHLTKRVNEIAEEKGYSSKDLAAIIYEPIGCWKTPGCGQAFINKIRSGRAHQITPSAYRKTTEKGKKQLYKISVLLAALEIEASDPLVQRFSRNYSEFRYPPENNSKA